jgi:YVTN family beta-propeller protein
MKWLPTNSRLMPALAAIAMAAAGCHSSTSVPSRGAGAIVLSADDSKLYVADTDNNQLVVVDNVTRKTTNIRVGNGPERAIVASDGRVFVSNRQDRSVSLVDPVAGRELIRIAVGSEPTGLSLSPDGSQLVVANTTSNTLSIIDTKALAVTRTISTPADPYGVLFHPNGKIYVTHQRSGAVSVYNGSTGEQSHDPMFLVLDPSKTGGEPRLPGAPTDPVLGDSGRVYIPHVQSKQTPTATAVGSPPGSYAGGGGAPGAVAVVASGVASIDTSSSDRFLNGQGLESFGGVAVPACGGCGSGTPAPAPAPSGFGIAPSTSQPLDNAPPVILTTVNGQPLSGPSGIAMEPNGKFLYMTNMNSGNVAILSTNGSLPTSQSSLAGDAPSSASPTNGLFALVKVGAGPKGIAITASGDRAYVFNAFDESVSVLGATAGQVTQQDVFSIATSPLTPQQQLGRKLFFAADDARMTNPAAGGIACASCHPGGREDGRTWQFSEGARNTPTLAGRRLATTAPYHWDGLLNDMHAFTKIVEDRMGGSGGTSGASTQPALTETDFNDMLAFLDAQPAPDNPALNKDGTIVNAGAAQRGKAIFEGAAGCVACHTGGDLTDNAFHDVGTENHLTLGGTAELFPNHVNTPTLRNIFYSAPYLHDGSAATLLDRVNDDMGGKHGTTSGLSKGDKDDLVAYLQTL